MTQMIRNVRLDLRPGLYDSVVLDDPLDGAVDVAAGVRALTLSAGRDRIPSLTLHLDVETTEVQGEMTVRIPDATATLLVSLGWTPPTDGRQQ